MSGYLEYCRMKGAEVVFWTAWNRPDPTLDAFRATAETRLRSYFKNEGRIGALEPKDEFRGLLIPEVIRFIRDDGTKPDDFCYDLDDLLRSNELKPSA